MGGDCREKQDAPVLGITMGDPCGIGPEVTARALADPQLSGRLRPLVVGSAEVLSRAIALTGVPLSVHTVHASEEATFVPGQIDVYDLPADLKALPYGTVTTEGGKAAFCAVEKVIELAMAGAVDGTVTGPLNKEAMNLAGYRYDGHTEIYAEKTGVRNYGMMLAHGNLRVVHVSTHVSLREACNRCRKDRVLSVICLTHEACQALGIEQPRIAVAGLNPHAGENGLFGREEIEEIIPAIEQARLMGMDVAGPIPPDTVFCKARGGMYDIVVAQYHDQGHIPLKLAGFCLNEKTGKWDSVSGVNITLGLPIVRAAVDHGTAFDLAGKGVANAESMVNAIEYGISLAKLRKKEAEKR